MTNSSIIPKSRLEAFSDAVIAIILTIMVLEMKTPHGAALAALKPLIPVWLSYVLSFLYLGIYWNNHHHLLHAVRSVSGLIMWANLHLLFWLSLIPFVTGWLGENPGAPWPTFFYGAILLLCAVAYIILQGFVVQSHGKDSCLSDAVGKDWKGRLSLASYILAVCLAYWQPWIATGLYIAVAVLWIIPDKRMIRSSKC